MKIGDVPICCHVDCAHSRACVVHIQFHINLHKLDRMQIVELRINVEQALLCGNCKVCQFLSGLGDDCLQTRCALTGVHESLRRGDFYTRKCPAEPYDQPVRREPGAPRKRFMNRKYGVGPWRGMRIEAGLTARELGKQAGISASTISTFERGCNIRPSAKERLEKLYMSLKKD